MKERQTVITEVFLLNLMDCSLIYTEVHLVIHVP